MIKIVQNEWTGMHEPVFENQNPFDTHAELAVAVAKAYKRQNIKYSKAVYDDAGNCTLCGEAGRCPGVHALADWDAD